MDITRFLPFGVVLALALISGCSEAPAPRFDKKPAGDKKADSEAVSGKIKSIGSDTMNNLMTFWAEGFRKLYPNVQPEIEGKGSTTAPPALIAGTAQFGPMSRP